MQATTPWQQLPHQWKPLCWHKHPRQLSGVLGLGDPAAAPVAMAPSSAPLHVYKVRAMYKMHMYKLCTYMQSTMHSHPKTTPCFSQGPVLSTTPSVPPSPHPRPRRHVTLHAHPHSCGSHPTCSSWVFRHAAHQGCCVGVVHRISHQHGHVTPHKVCPIPFPLFVATL